MQIKNLEIASQKSAIWSTGLAMFGMFFGAGNIVFPLALGQFTQDKNFFGIMGLLITAVVVPFLGLLAMLLYEGDYLKFFRRIGKVPGFILSVLILGLIGPLAGIPRCITISHSTVSAFGFDFLNHLNLSFFSLLSCFLIFLFTFRPNRLLPLLGYVLTPALLLSLGVLIVKGFLTKPIAAVSSYTAWQTFSQGLLAGYNTMDLLAAFFFSSVVLVCLRKERFTEKIPLRDNSRLFSVILYSSLIAAVLLAGVYIGFSYLAAGFSNELVADSKHEMLGILAFRILGPYAGLLTGCAVSFACLTTEIALTAVFAEFLHKTLFRKKISYTMSVLFTLVTAFIVSTLDFDGISTFLVPVLQLFYPGLIVLSVMSIFHKVFEDQLVKKIFYATIGTSLAAQITLQISSLNSI